MEKNRYLKISGGVDNHYKKRVLLTALLLGALFCWGNNEVKAYIYDNIQIDIEGTFFQINEDENDLILKNESRINAPNI